MRPEGNILLLTCTSLWLDPPVLLHILTVSILTDHHLYHAASQKQVITNIIHCSPHSGKSATIRESNQGSGVCKEHYVLYYVPKSSILFNGNGAVKISFVASEKLYQQDK